MTLAITELFFFIFIIDYYNTLLFRVCDIERQINFNYYKKTRIIIILTSHDNFNCRKCSNKKNNNCHIFIIFL